MKDEADKENNAATCAEGEVARAVRRARRTTTLSRRSSRLREKEKKKKPLRDHRPEASSAWRCGADDALRRKGRRGR
eukprot:2021859-Heterocapsa_arctica.AAC.1